MRTGREEALTVFRAWLEDRSLLRCEFRFALLAATFTARMAIVSTSELRLISDDKSSELVLPLREDLEFEYGDMRQHPQHVEEFDKMLIVFFQYLGDPAQADMIVFVEIIG